jgi:hypothetical protein
MNFKIWMKALTLALPAALVIVTTGCQSFDEPATSNLASVTITNRPMADVQAAVTNVFVARQFTGGQSGTNQFTYRRPGSRADNIAYGSYMFDRSVTVKVVVTTQQQAAGEIVVGCNAWLVESENDPVFQENHPVRRFGRGPYEQLLKDIKTQVGE